MKILKKFAQTLMALLPILVIVLFVHFFVYKFDTKVLINFIVAIVLVGVGESLLLTGIDSTIMPMGEMMVNAVNKASKFVFFMVFAVVFGMFATIAEPDVTVFSEQVIASGVSIAHTLLVFVIGAGVGLLIALAIFRIIKNIDIKYVYLVIFALIFLLCTQVKTEYIAIAFDAGGATTGIITAPFLLAISSGISSKMAKNHDNDEVFGMVGLASLGPVIAILMVFAFAGEKTSTIVEGLVNNNIYLTTLKNASLATIPLMVVFFVYDLLFIKLSLRKKAEFIIGMIITFVGLFIFLFAIEFGITEMGTAFGTFLKQSNTTTVILISIVFGFVITFCEPSVIVLSKQVESVTKGNIPYFVVMISIAVSMALAILISSLKILFQINFFYIILIGYLIALLLMFFVPSIFTSLAFDSGGVASGPMTSAFLLPIMIGLASGTANPLDGFGLIGIVGMCPIIVLQVLGLVYKVEVNVKTQHDQRNALKISYTADMYSNMQALEIEHKKLLMRRKNEK